MALRTGLVHLLRTRAAFAAKVVFRYRLHADKLIGITGLAPPSMSSFRANILSDPTSQPGPFLLPIGFPGGVYGPSWPRLLLEATAMSRRVMPNPKLTTVTPTSNPTKKTAIRPSPSQSPTLIARSGFFQRGSSGVWCPSSVATFVILAVLS